MIGVLYHAAPNVKMPGFKWVTVGSLVALVVWILASAAFAFYVANFGSYDKTYGTLGGLISLLVWFWISNLALLFGLELNAERERSRELAAGVPRADKEIQLEPRERAEGQADHVAGSPGRRAGPRSDRRSLRSVGYRLRTGAARSAGGMERENQLMKRLAMLVAVGAAMLHTAGGQRGRQGLRRYGAEHHPLGPVRRDPAARRHPATSSRRTGRRRCTTA